MHAVDSYSLVKHGDLQVLHLVLAAIVHAAEIYSLGLQVLHSVQLLSNVAVQFLDLYVPGVQPVHGLAMRSLQ